MKKSQVYTKAGDQGKTYSPYGKVLKSDPWIHLVGSLDETQAVLGNLYESLTDVIVKEQLKAIMKTVFKVSGDLYRQTGLLFDPSFTESIEGWIDYMDSQMPPLSNFILPIGSKESSIAHYARSVCRRTERAFIDASLNHPDMSTDPLAFINRLSDYLFVLARYINYQKGISDVLSKD